VGNKVIGAMVLQSYTNKQAYTNNDVALLEFVAANISHAIDHSRNLEQLNLLKSSFNSECRRCYCNRYRRYYTIC